MTLDLAILRAWGTPTSEWAAERIEALEAEILRLVDALEFAHSSGFEWPVDPLPFGSIAHDLFICRGNDPERIALNQSMEEKDG